MIKKVLYRLTMAFASLLSILPAVADSSENVTVYVGETKTLTVPGYIADNAIITHFSIGYTDCLQRVSSTRTGIRVRGIKSSPTIILVTCNWQLSTLETGQHLFKVTVKERNTGSTGVAGSKDTVTLPDSICMEIGESRKVTAVTDAGMSVMWTWMGGDAGIVTRSVEGTYDQTAVFTGVTSGSTDVYAKSSKGGMSRMNITVVEPLVAKSVTLSKESLVLAKGEEYTLEADVQPSNATNGELSWSSSDASVAIVDANGTVKAVESGTAFISVTTRGGLSDRCMVSVQSKTTELIIDDAAGVEITSSVADVTYTRQLYKGWNSFCLPFALTLEDLPEGCRMAATAQYQVTGGKETLVFDIVQRADAGMSFLVYAPENTVLQYQGKSVPLVSSPTDDSIMAGSFTRKVIGVGCYKLNAEGTAFGITRTADAICAPFRMYIPAK